MKEGGGERRGGRGGVECGRGNEVNGEGKRKVMRKEGRKGENRGGGWGRGREKDNR